MRIPEKVEKQYEEIKKVALGHEYDLSVSFVSPEQIQDINRTYRGYDKPTDILSFELEKDAGEIFICPNICKEKAKLHGRTDDNYLLFIFIHGLIHLKGFDHGATMEKLERSLREQFGV